MTKDELATQAPERFPPGGLADLGFVFVTGSHKSGTTWLMRMLNTHPAIAISFEASFVGFELDVRGWLNTAGFLRWAEKGPRRKLWSAGVDLAVAQKVAKRGMIEAVLRALLWRPGVTLVGDKTPLFYLRAPRDLHELFPEAFFVHIVRDGRDVAVSHMFHVIRLELYDSLPPTQDIAELQRIRDFYLGGNGPSRPLFSAPMLRNFAGKWRRSVLGGKEAAGLFRDRYVEIRYEDLLRDPRAQLAQVLRRLGVDASPETVGRCVGAQTFESLSGRKPGEGDPKSFFRKGVSGDWRTHFTEEDRTLFKAIAGDALIELGYAADLDW